MKRLTAALKLSRPQAASKAGAISRTTAWAAIISGILGFVSFGALFTYLTTQARQFMDTGVMPVVGRLLLTTNALASAAHVLLLIPVVLGLHLLVGSRRSWGIAVIGIVALGSMAFLRILVLGNLLLAKPAISDILFMAPAGFVGLWLIAANLMVQSALPLALRIIGVIAGLGLATLGASFFFLGGLAVLTEGPFELE